MPVLPTLAFTFAAFMALLNLTTIHAASEEEHETKKANWNCCLACQDAPQAIHPEPTVYPPECFTKCTYTVTKYTAAISKKCKCDPDKEAAAAKASRLEDDPPSLDPSEIENPMGSAAASMESEQPLMSDVADVDTMTPLNIADDNVNPRERRSKDATSNREDAQRHLEALVFATDPAPVSLRESYMDDAGRTEYGLVGSSEETGDKIFKVRSRRHAGFSVEFAAEPEVPREEVDFSPALMNRMRRGSKKMHEDCPDNPFKICKVKPTKADECDEETKDLVPNKCVGPCGRLGPGYLSAYGVNSNTEFRIIYRAKNLTYEVIFPSEIVDWENIDFDKYEKKRVTQIVRQKGGMEAIRKSTSFTGCNCDGASATEFQNDEPAKQDGHLPNHGKENRR